MVRTQIQLSEAQAQALKEMADERDVSMAELIRQAVDRWLEAEHLISRDERKRRALAAAGRYHSGLTDIAEDHDRYLAEAYEVESAGLIDGGADLLIIETQFDLLGAKAAIEGARRAMKAAGTELPLQVQVTIELTGRMLPGTEIGAALTALEAMRPDVIGLNCSVGPAAMLDALESMAEATTRPLSAQPNAGLPRTVKDRKMYMASPEYMARYGRRLIDAGARFVGGCCGTTPEHIKQLAATVASLQPRHAAVSVRAPHAEGSTHAEPQVAPAPLGMTASVVLRLQVSAEFLLFLDRFEQRLEVPLAEALRAFTLNDLIEQRRAILDGLREDLKQIAVRVSIDQDPELLERVERLVDLADALLQLLVVRGRSLQELDPAIAESCHRFDDVVGRQREVLSPRPSIEVQVFLDLRLLLA